MNAVIKIASATSFTEDQEKILKRVCIVLTEHHLSICIKRKVKTTKIIKLKTA
jgi:hypothetical protein